MAAASTTQPPPYFEGWYLPFDSTEAINCATTETFSMQGNFAGCCPTDSACNIITSCAEGTVTGIPGAIGCLSPGACITMTVFDHFPSGQPFYSNLICGQDWAALTVYRTLGSSSTTASSSSSAPTSTSGATSGSSATVASQTASSTTPPTTSSSGGGAPAWIAGAVMGPIAAIALVVLAFWLGRRSSRRKAAAASAAQGGYAGGAYANQPYKADASHASSGYPGELEGNYTGYPGHTSPPAMGQYQAPAEVPATPIGQNLGHNR